MSSDRRGRKDDPFLLNYNPTELRIASEFLSNWLPFLSKGLCHHCSQTLSDRVRSLDPVDGDGDTDSKGEEDLTVQGLHNLDLNDFSEDGNNCDAHSIGSWKDEAQDCSEPATEASASETVGPSSVTLESPRTRLSWADMAQEDELEGDEENELNRTPASGEGTSAGKVRQKQELSREQREYIRFSNVKRKKDFICLERIGGKIVNILGGLELHAGVFSAAEQKRIVDYVYALKEIGQRGEFKERTYTAPQKWMRGKGRVTIQFGCCYNYAMDKDGNPPGILQNEIVDPIPHLFKVIIRRLVSWHVLPPSCVPDSCIVNIYEKGDCIPPHIDNHDFVRPFCTVSFLSECNIVFGSNLTVVGPGEFSGPVAVPLPVGSVLVLNGNGADVAKHCVPAVPSERISITFRRMDESKRPFGYAPEPDLQGLQPLSYGTDRPGRSAPSKSNLPGNRPAARREDNREKSRRLARKGNNFTVPQVSIKIERGPDNRRRVRVNLNE
ncbi:RNA demethylase ALKBH9B isoform X2 [Diospyros lotus]|uniref:RNA demethylase ALKBH9B isoform X2 n=1 Tax=Diospyros lotus TaxID=55363 RepID=UPI00225863D7|nr:RNA demethylase ALKBH9B isoform X2 [Diospyros lotus]